MGMYFEDIKLHAVYELNPVVMEKEKMLSFARDYDHIPLHTDEEYAKKTHFGALIAPGVMTFMSVWMRFIDEQVLGDELIAGKSTKMEWINPVYAGDVLRGRAQITGKTVRNAKNGIVEVTVQIFNQNGVLVLEDVTETIIKRRPAA